MCVCVGFCQVSHPPAPLLLAATCVAMCRLWLNALLGLIFFLAFCILQRSVFPQHFRFRLVRVGASIAGCCVNHLGGHVMGQQQFGSILHQHLNLQSYHESYSTTLHTRPPQVSASVTVKPRDLPTQGFYSLWYVCSNSTAPQATITQVLPARSVDVSAQHAAALSRSTSARTLV